MDLVKLVTEQLSGDVLRSLGSLIGADSESTREAAGAAVPALLSGLAGMAQTDDGARKLASTINNLETSVPGGLGALGNLAGMLGGDAGGDASSVPSLGGRLLSSLFGDSLSSGIANAVGRFAGLDASLTKKLLAWLLPLVLGVIGSRWKNQGGSIGGLASLFADQKQNIARAAPSGFNLASIPGLPGIDSALRVTGDVARRTGDAATDVARRTRRAADEGSRTLLNWLWPLLALAALLGGLWFFFGRGPREVVNKAANTAATAANTAAESTQRAADKITALRPQLPDVTLPDITSITKDVSGIFTSAKESLASITDAASAQAALPDLHKLSSRIDGIRNYFDKLPAAAQATLGNTIGKQFANLQAEADKVLAMPGISPQVRAALEGITNKLYGLNVAQVSKDTTDIFTSLTKTLEGASDAASAEAALPELKVASEKLGKLGRVKAAMSPGGQTMLSRLVAAARGPLDQLITKVLTQLGADAVAVKPILDQIVDQVASLAEPPEKT
ncbi:MAG: DUF937 domain-containing protein [Planctomycetaceae bacterium]|nr:DUF937 domain-containing protein [Planctomycetaceae bacterium]